MIVFDVQCEAGHVFEGWFSSNEAFEGQRKAGVVACPVCGSTKVEKALMAPNVTPKKGLSPTEEKNAAEQAMKTLVKMRKAVEENCDYVGGEFAEEARKIHYGETEGRNIYGEASSEEAEALTEEGIDFTQIPWVPNADN
ncbi:MAG: DUF1178 family protein [Minwuiales bacterium]|nr:DUF1178 family protein [Minwuiales bacterium]